MIQARIDHMDDMDQLVIKSAAVLGVSFLRELLHEVLPQNITSEQCGMSIKRLADSDIFICGFAGVEHDANMCMCPDSDGRKRAKSMENCQFVKFLATTFQQTAYQMFLEKTRNTLHMKAARFLESLPHMCTACGGDIFLQCVWLKYNDNGKIILTDVLL